MGAFQTNLIGYHTKILYVICKFIFDTPRKNHVADYAEECPVLVHAVCREDYLNAVIQHNSLFLFI